jgi:hypothetical protein
MDSGIINDGINDRAEVRQYRSDGRGVKLLRPVFQPHSGPVRALEQRKM